MATIGPKLQIDGFAEYKRNIDTLIQQGKTLESEMKLLESTWDKNTTVQEKAAGKVKILAQEIDAQKQKVAQIAEVVQKATEKYGADSAEVQKWTQAQNKAQAELNKMQHELDDCNDELNDQQKELKESQKETKDLGTESDKAGDKAAKFGAAAKAAAAVAAAAFAAATAAVVKLGKAVISQYAGYEQLVGGVETLFKDSAKEIQDYANNAYKTAGMSANEYMETVTGFSASLISSLGGDTAKAAQYADMAITDMSDNANKMGSDIESVINAYAGFAKGQYNMLDNLKLGYGGTKEEMERLIEDAEKLNTSFKAQRDADDKLVMSYSDIVDAIHIVQTEMGITGTTAKEASETISGSVASAKAAWLNLVTGLADGNADLSDLINKFVESIKTAAGNIVPVVMQSLIGMGQLITELAPVIANAIPGFVSDVLPGLLAAITTVVSALVDALSDDANLDAIIDAGIDMLLMLINGFVKALPKIVKALVKIIKSLAKALTENIKPIMDAATETILEIINILTDPEFLPYLIQAGIDLLMALVNGLIAALPQLIQAIPLLITSLIDAIVANLPMIIDCGIQLVQTLIDGLIDNLPALMDAAIEIILALVDALTDPEMTIKMIEASIELIIALGKGLIEALPTLIEKIPELIMGIYDALIDNSFELLKAGKKLIESMGDGISQKWEDVKQWGKDIITKIGQSIADTWGKVIAWGEEIIDKIGSGVIGCWETVKQWGKDIIDTIWTGITLTWEAVKQWGGSIIDKVKEGFSSVYENIKGIGKNIVEGVWEGIKSMGKWIKEKVTGFFGGIVNSVKGLLGIASPSKVFASIGKFTAEGFGKGFDKAFADVADDVKAQMSDITSPFQITGKIAAAGSRMMGSALQSPSSFQLPDASAYGGQTNNYNRNIASGAVSVQVYAAPGQSAESIADVVMDKINRAINSESAVWA